MRKKQPRIEEFFDCEEICLTDEILEKYKLSIDETKIEKFEDINFISLLEE